MIVEINDKRFDDEYSERANIYNYGDEINGLYGATFGTMTDEDIKALQDGKLIHFFVEDEYTIVLRKG